MFKSLIGSLGQIAAKPQVLLAGIIATVFQTIIFYFSLTPLANVFDNAVLLGELPNVSLIELPFQFYKMYASDLNVILVFLLLSMIVQFWLAIVVARFAENTMHKKQGILEAIGFGIASFWKIIGAIVFLLAAAGIFFALFQIIIWLSDFSQELSLILMLLLAVFTAYLFVKLLFFLQIMGAKAANARIALLESWNFSKKRFWFIVILIVILSIISGLIDFAGSLASEPFGDSIIATIVLAFFSILGTTYSTLVLANYYLNHEVEHGKLFYEGRKRHHESK